MSYSLSLLACAVGAVLYSWLCSLPPISWLMLNGLVTILLNSYRQCLLREAKQEDFCFYFHKSVITHLVITSASYDHFDVLNYWKFYLCTQLSFKLFAPPLVIIRPVICIKGRNIRSCTLCNRYGSNDVCRWLHRRVQVVLKTMSGDSFYFFPNLCSGLRDK